MSNNATTPAPATPAFDAKTAQRVTPYRHEANGRTVGHHQPQGDDMHLFSATGVFIATVKKAQAAKQATEAKAAKLAADAAAVQANAAHHLRAVALANMSPQEREDFLRAEAKAAQAAE